MQHSGHLSVYESIVPYLGPCLIICYTGIPVPNTDIVSTVSSTTVTRGEGLTIPHAGWYVEVYA